MFDLAPKSIRVSKACVLPGQFRSRSFAVDGLAVVCETATAPQTLETQEQAYARGFEDGRSQTATQFDADQTRMRALVANAIVFEPEPSEELAALIVEAVVKLARLAIGNAPIDGEWLVARAHEAAAIIADCDAARTVWVHPDDAAFLTEAGLGLNIHSDPDAERGSIRIACSSGWIEHGRPLYLEKIDALRYAA
jgi:flagellar assembly protein FliH